jgi:hypothetical protein
MSDIDSILAQNVNQTDIDNVVLELMQKCGLYYPKKVNNYTYLHNAIKAQRNKILLKRNGRRFSSLIHINASVDKQSYNDTVCTYNKFLSAGCGYFVSGKVYFDTAKQCWCLYKPKEGNVYVNINIIDKIKVRSIFLSSANISRQYSMTGTSGVNNRCSKKMRDMFLQEVSNCKDPVATWARYRAVENGLALAVGPNDVSVNTINVNMPRGVHEHILLMRTIACYHKGNNPSARISSLVEHFKLNNNSVTIDSVFSSIKNEISFINECIIKKDDFNILPKAEFRTHKLLMAYNNDTFSTYHKDTDMRKSIPIKGIEMQVHQRCLNCSAISGNQLLHIIQEIIVDLLNYAQRGKISIDICLVNAKALCEKLSHSLIIPCINDFCEILCRKLGTFRMNITEQMQTFESKVSPLLRKIFMSRDNYAACGVFTSITPLGSRLLTVSDSAIVSHKYRNKETHDLFDTLKESDLSPQLRDFMTRVNQHRYSSFNDINKVNSKKNTGDIKFIRRKKKRTAGIVYNVACGQRRYITALQKYNIPLPTADEV